MNFSIKIISILKRKKISFFTGVPDSVLKALSVYLENKNVNGLTVRATIENVLGAENRFRRTVYADRLANEILFSERFSRSFGFAYTLTIEGSF